MAHRQRLVYADGEWMWQDVAEAPATATASPHRQAITESRPWVSRAMAVHREQVEKFNSEAKEAGLTGIHYEPDGRCVATSRGQRRMEMKRRGMLDRDAGYGDAG